MMHGHEKSDPAIVAVKPANKAERSAAELVERRAGTEGNAHQQSTHWTQSRARVSQTLERIRQAFAVTHPRWEPYAGKPQVRYGPNRTVSMQSASGKVTSSIQRWYAVFKLIHDWTAATDSSRRLSALTYQPRSSPAPTR